MPVMRYNKWALRRLRKAKGLKVEELAKRANVSRGAVLYADRGATIPRADTLGKIATVLQVSTDAFYEDGAA